LIEEEYRRKELGLETMSQFSYDHLKQELGKPNMGADYPWCYDPLLMREYYEGTGYKPAFFKD
jgi:hypothetical protein